MSSDLITLDKKKLNALVKTMPTNKRAAFAKAAKAAVQHAKDSRKNYRQAFDLAVAMIENWWYLGNEVKQLGIKAGGDRQSKKHPPLGEDALTLEDIGINYNQSSRCQKLSERPKEELDEWLAEGYDEETRYFPSLKPASEGKPHVTNNSGENEWYTPPEFLESAREVMGSIDCDPATSEKAQETVRAESYFTQETNGLEQEWGDNVWMNPPYATGLIGPFISKLCDEVEAGRVSQAIILTNNATDTEWFAELAEVATAFCFKQSRIRFLDADGEPGKAPLQGQVFTYIGKDWRGFVNEYRQHGLVVLRK